MVGTGNDDDDGRNVNVEGNGGGMRENCAKEMNTNCKQLYDMVLCSKMFSPDRHVVCFGATVVLCSYCQYRIGMMKVRSKTRNFELQLHLHKDVANCVIRDIELKFAVDFGGSADSESGCAIPHVSATEAHFVKRSLFWVPIRRQLGSCARTETE